MTTFFTYKSSKESLAENIELIRKVITKLGWKITNELNDGFECKTSASLASFGEMISIKVIRENINITVESKVKTSIADSGKGSLRIKNFIEAFQRQE